MSVHRKTGERSIALLLLGALAFSPPLLLIFGAEVSVFGIPLLYVYLFAAWAVLIGFAAVIARRSRPGANRASRTAPAPGRSEI